MRLFHIIGAMALGGFLSGCASLPTTTTDATETDKLELPPPPPKVVSIANPRLSWRETPLQSGAVHVDALPNGRLIVEAREAHMSDLVLSISKVSQRSVLPDNRIGIAAGRSPSGLVSIRLYNVRPLTAIEAIAQTCGYGVSVNGGNVMFTKEDSIPKS